MNDAAASLRAAWYADRAVHQRAEVVENVWLARDTWRLRLACPDIAARILPGQFVMVRLAGCDDPLLGRAFALYDTVIEQDAPIGIDIVYLVVGKLTSRLAALIAGGRLEVWGPLGNGFLPSREEHLVMVAGGIGQTPFPALAAERLGVKSYGAPPRPAPPVKRLTLCYGARSAELLAGIDDFERLGVEVRISTDDGSRGHHGLVTEVLAQVIEESAQRIRVVCCGPEPMMEAVAKLTAKANLPCEVSLESPMACGIGICFSCVARVREPDGSWDYKRTCVEGPVFDAGKIVW